MAVPNTLHTLFRSPLVSIQEYRCRPHGPDGRRDEQSREHGVVFLRSGVFERHVGRESAVADANGVAFFNAGQPYRVTHPVSGGDHCVVLRARPDVLADMLRPFNPAAGDGAAPFAFLNGPCDSRTYLTLRRLVRGLEHSTSADPPAVEEAALKLMADAVAAAYRVRGLHPDRGTAVAIRANKPQTRRAHAEWAEQAQVVLAARFHERLALDEVARAVHASPYHLCRVFRRHTGTSIHQYLTRLRLRAALDRLMDGRPDLTKLALELGFSSHSHLTTTFAREFGAAPSAIRMPAFQRTVT